MLVAVGLLSGKRRLQRGVDDRIGVADRVVYVDRAVPRNEVVGTELVMVVVEASEDLANGPWTPVGTNQFQTSNYSYFSDPDWANHPARYYRIKPLN